MHLALLSIARAATPSPEQIAALSGRWRLAEPRAVVQFRVDAAVDAGLAPFNFMVRSMARPIMRQAAVICDGYLITLTPTSFTLACDAFDVVSAGFGQPPRSWESADGHTFAVTSRVEGDSVWLDYTGEAGTQHVQYRSGADGVFLVHKTMHSNFLNVDATWDMRYQRAE